MNKFVNKWGEPTPSKPVPKNILNNTGWHNMNGGGANYEEKADKYDKKYLKMKEKYLRLKSQLNKI